MKMRDGTIFCSIVLSVLFLFPRIYCYFVRLFRRKKYLCFFHPYCNNGGGGERVLWITILGLLSPTAEDSTISFVDKYNLQVVIYNGDASVSKEQILQNVEKKFEIHFSEPQRQKLQIVNISLTTLLEARWYPIATMIGQSIGSVIVALEAAIRLVPDYYYDTIGVPFSFPVIQWWTGSEIIAYVHYPVISSDMLQRVREQRPSYNNNQRIATNLTVSSLKLTYYQLFARGFSFVGSFPGLIMVNSTWTLHHIMSLWHLIQNNVSTKKKKSESSTEKEKQPDQRRLVLIYPPCNTHLLQSIPLTRPKYFSSQAHASSEAILSGFLDREREVWENQMLIISIGQFRPEKDHYLQIEIMNEIRRRNQSRSRPHKLMLLMFGSTRNDEDRRYVQQLQQKIDSDSLQSLVQIHVNQSYDVIKFFLATAQIGLHTMWNEHFGISVVEMMAAGVVTVAHKSGGPKEDIIEEGINGYLADSVEGYADALETIYQEYAKKTERIQMLQVAARWKAEKFSDENFVNSTLENLELFLS